MKQQTQPADAAGDVQLATRIPKQLHRDLRLHCTENDTSLMQFVRDALREHLDAATKKVVPLKRKARKVKHEAT